MSPNKLEGAIERQEPTGFGKLLDRIERIRDSKESETIEAYVEDEDHEGLTTKWPVTIGVSPQSDGGLEIMVKANYGSEVLVELEDLKSAIASLYETPLEQVEAIHLKNDRESSLDHELADREREINDLRRQLEESESENIKLLSQVEMAESHQREFEANSKKQSARITELEARLTSYELDEAEEDSADEQQLLPKGMTVDNLGVFRQRYFSPEYMDLMQDIPVNDFRGTVSNSLLTLAEKLSHDSEEDKSWSGKNRPTELSSAEWQKRLPRGYSAQMQRQPLTGIPPEGITDFSGVVMGTQLTLILDIDKRAKNVTGRGPALAEARSIAGQIMNMNRSRPSEFLLSIIDKQQRGGLEAERVEFVVKMDIDGVEKILLRVSQPTLTYSELKTRLAGQKKK
ncbi:hypothetical protein KC722_00975 [Candidatus Kaiserbacteria bacterium]|nr:hypothetical protein [Candidatus Kaiserbacteria bacterium]MCB9811754.1 hypothetical protein [Candidatus Nomurabacteria bacterium]